MTSRVDEAKLIEQACKGDIDAYKQIYNQYVNRVYAVCLRLSADPSIAEDATQEVFIQLWKKLDNYSQQSRFSTWLHSVATNVTISYLRKQKTWWQRTFSIDEIKENAELPEVSTEGSAESIDLEKYIYKLPERARWVFVLHAIEGFRHEDIAQMLDMAVGSSKAQFHRAKTLLTGWIDDSQIA